MEPTRTEMLEKVRAFCAQNASAVLYDEPGEALLDVPSAKTWPLRVAELTRVEQRTNPQTGRVYLLLLYGDGTQVALADAGIAFPPDTRNTGPLEPLPPVVCLKDYGALLTRFKHELYDHPDRPPTKDTALLLMMCIAVVDGAREVGFDVSREVRELEQHLGELEKRGASVT